MEIIKEKDVESLNLTTKEMLTWVENTLANKYKCVLPQKISMKLDNHVFYNVMPCVVPYYDIVGLKLVSRIPPTILPPPYNKNASLNSNIYLFDLQTGGQKINAIIESNFITTWRTACVAVNSVKLFAKKDFTSVAVIGLGCVGTAFIKALLDTFSNKKLTIKLFDYKGSAKNILNKYKDYKNASFDVYNNYEEMAKSADVIVSAVTYLENDLANPDIYKPGVLIIPIHTRGFMECDLRFDKIFCDDKAHIQNFKYFNQYKNCHEVSEVINKKCPGRENDKERIIVYNIGIAIHDLVFAYEIYKKLLKK